MLKNGSGRDLDYLSLCVGYVPQFGPCVCRLYAWAETNELYSQEIYWVFQFYMWAMESQRAGTTMAILGYELNFMLE